MLNFSPSCERNKQVILAQLKSLLTEEPLVLEIGSLSGQHALHFCQHLPELNWQCSDMSENLPALTSNVLAAQLTNCLAPIELTLGVDFDKEELSYDAVYSANTLHIVAWPLVEDFFSKVEQVCRSGGLLIVYGPFKYQGGFTSESNAEFELWLKNRDPLSGIRDFEAINQLAQKKGFSLQADIAMPANNQLLVWQKVN